MVGGSNIKSGAAYYELFLKDGKLTKGLRAAQAKLRAFAASAKAMGSKLMGLGAAMAAPLAAAVGVFTNASKEMAEASEKSGVAVEALSTLAFAAKQCGVPFEELQGGLGKMQRKLGEAETGNEAAAMSFAKLGLSIADLKDLSPDKQFELIADKIQSIQDPALRTAATMEIFGKSGADLIPLLAQGAAGIERYVARAKELGLQMSTADVEAGLAFSKSLSEVWEQIRMVGFQIGAALAPALKDLTGKATEWLSTVIKFVKAHREVIVTYAKITAGVFAAGAALFTLGHVFTSVAAVLGGFATALSVAGTAIGVVVSVIGTILSPVGLAAAAIVGLGVVFEQATGGISKAVNFLGDVFDGLKSDALMAFAGIRDALMAGDIAGAANIAWLMVKLEFDKGVAALSSVWQDLKAGALSGMNEAMYLIGRISIGGWTEIKRIWNEAANGLLDILSVLGNKTGHVLTNAFAGWKIAFIEAKEAMGILREGEAHAQINQAKRDAKSDNAKSDNKMVDEIGARDKAAKAEDERLKGELNAAQRKALDDLKNQHDATNAEIAKNAADAKAEAQTDITKAKLALRSAIFDATEAHKKEAHAVLQDAGQNVKKQQQDIIDMMKSSEAGTFSAATAARQLGMGNQGGAGHGAAWGNRAGAHWQGVNKEEKQLAEQRKANALLARIATAVGEGVGAGQFF